MAEPLAWTDRLSPRWTALATSPQVVPTGKNTWSVSYAGRNFRAAILPDERFLVEVESNGEYRSDLVSSDDRMAIAEALAN